VQIRLITYSHVEAGGKPAPSTIRPMSPDAAIYLVQHMTAMRSHAADGSWPPAEFVDPTCEHMFEELRVGTKERFLSAASTVVQRLIGRMRGNTSPGLLVCMQIDDNPEPSAAILKLEVGRDYAGVLQRLETGEEQLGAVQNVLDPPGKLQKGALVIDRRPDSQVVIGDKLADTAKYFPEALGIRQIQKAKPATIELIRAVHSIAPEAARSLERKLRNMAETSSKPLERVERVLEELDLPSTQVDDVRGMLENQPRPVRTVDVRKPISLTIEADSITVSGPAADIDEKVETARQADGSWHIIVRRIYEEPRRKYT
jgi:hypothetical protein